MSKITKNESLDLIVKTFLDGKTTYVRAGGLYIQGSDEGRCVLKYDQYHGIRCTSTLQWNSSKVSKEFMDQIRFNREPLGMGYNLMGSVMGVINKVLDCFFVQLGRISMYDIRSYEILYNDKYETHRMTDIYITYNTGEVIRLEHIK